MQVSRQGDFEERFRVADHGIGQKTAVGEDGQRVANCRRLLGDLPGRIRPFGDQTIEEMNGVVGVREGREQRSYAPPGGGRKSTEVNKFRARTNGVAELDLVK